MRWAGPDVLSSMADRLVLEVDVQNVLPHNLRKLWSTDMPAGIKGLVVKIPSQPAQALPADLQWSRFTKLRQLDISTEQSPRYEPLQVRVDCDVESSGALSSANVSSSSAASSSSTSSFLEASDGASLLNSICQLSSLTDLDFSGCSELEALPAGLHKLTKLEKLSLRGCSKIERLPQGFESCKALTHLDLSKCESLKYLPHKFGDKHDGLTKLTHLDLSDCTSLTELPESLVKMKGLLSLKLKGCGVPHSRTLCVILSQIYLGRRVSFHDCTPQWQLRRVGTLQQQQAAVFKLARQQEPMLTTLERMSWLVVLLATATFIAYLQPPGGFEGYKVPYYAQADDCLARLFNSSTPIYGSSSQVSCGNQTAQGSNGLTVNRTAQGSVNRTALEPDQADRACAAAAYYLFDGLSFGLSVGCVMTIVVLSMPRMQWADNRAEAGRFYILLSLTWALLYLAVTTGLCTFIMSGLVSHGNRNIVVVPVIPGIVLVTIGLGLLIRRFRSLFPGWGAVGTAIKFTWSWADRELRPVEDVAEMGQDKFWRYCFHKLPREPEFFSAGGLPVTVTPDGNVHLVSQGVLDRVFPQK